MTRSTRAKTSIRSLVGLLVMLVVGAAAVLPADGAAPSDRQGAELPWPDRRFASCGALDPGTGTLYTYGGRADDASTHLGDLWALDLGLGRGARPSWTLTSPAGSVGTPPAVRSCAVGWDEEAQRLIVFGGWDGATHDGGLRTFDPASGAWAQLCPATSCGVGPSARRASQLVVDAARNRVMVFTGTNGTYFDDLWSLSLDSMAWTRLEPSGPRPATRAGHSIAIAIAAQRDAVYLFGGTRPGEDLDELWRLDLLTDTWTEVDADCAESCPTARSGASLSYDATGDRFVLYAGWESTTNTYRREAWTLDDLDGVPTWRRIGPASEAPQARYFHVAGFDPLAQRLVVFGGGANGHAYKDAFGLSLPVDGAPAAWHSLAPTTRSPPATRSR